MNPLIGLLLYCRGGFEAECASEVQELASQHGVTGYCKAKTDSAHVVFMPHEEASKWLAQVDYRSLIFARQVIPLLAQLNQLPVTDRLTPVLELLNGQNICDVWVETPDTNEAKSLSGFLKKFSTPLRQALQKAKLLRDEPGLPRLHLCFQSSTSVMMGLSDTHISSPWLMGIPRLKFPAQAPSRSTLKLEEALLYFLTPAQHKKLLRPGMHAVDLGASPGGWSWQLIHRGLRVIAVDNGPMADALMQSGLLDHRREDGFRFRPASPVEWMVCDMVEQPIRIAQLVTDWITRGDCRNSIFNLKLPMKKRLQEVRRCEELIRGQLAMSDVHYDLSFKQLYHDRAEITGCIIRSQR